MTDKIQTAFWMPKPLKQALIKAAEKDKRTLSNLVVKILSDWVAKK